MPGDGWHVVLWNYWLVRDRNRGTVWTPIPEERKLRERGSNDDTKEFWHSRETTANEADRDFGHAPEPSWNDPPSDVIRSGKHNAIVETQDRCDTGTVMRSALVSNIFRDDLTCCNERNVGDAYTKPVKKIADTAIFCRLGIWSFQMAEMGKNRIAKSEATFMPPVEAIKAFTL